MGAEDRIRELAEQAPNFGYLLQHESLLVVHRAGAESYVFSDPNTSMIKARQFGDALAETAFLKLGLPSMPDKQFQRLNIMRDQGMLDERVLAWFNAVRITGNKATHQSHDHQRDALLLVRACYELGAWFHRTVTGAQDTPAFVPPQPRAEEPTSGQLGELLNLYRNDLIEMRLTIGKQTELAAAEAIAREVANREILAAVRGQGDLRKLVEGLVDKVAELQTELTARASVAPPVASAVRDEMIERSTIASRLRLNEVQVRRIVDRMLDDAGWVVQDKAAMNIGAGLGVAVREMTVGRGRADYLLYVAEKLVGMIEAKREGTSLTSVELLAEAFAGRLVPQTLDDEPASVLLERIRAERTAKHKTKRTRKAKPVQESLL
jgi:type I restriction enzyme R subunit